ncbi:hypothetical protein TNCV_4686141 [Trichonephila clavipes]|nr:hypothetical protein TNCV_4686141 [Trichonephila clavipes]
MLQVEKSTSPTASPYRYGNSVSGTNYTCWGPCSLGPRIIDTAEAVVATPLVLKLLEALGSYAKVDLTVTLLNGQCANRGGQVLRTTIDSFVRVCCFSFV